VTYAVVDDHLLRDLLADDPGKNLRRLRSNHDLATTNLYYVRLCKSVVAARGGQLTGGWSPERRRALGRSLLQLSDTILVVPMSAIGYRIAELSDAHRLSTLGAEAVAAAEHLDGSLWVWEGDDGPNIREAARTAGVRYHTVFR
jgi:hypothetical protein